jgi:hypothetical protein
MAVGGALPHWCWCTGRRALGGGSTSGLPVSSAVRASLTWELGLWQVVWSREEVVAVGEPFRGGVSGSGGSDWGGASDWEGFVLGVILTPFIKGAAALFWSRGKTWKVGILRHRNVKWGGIIRVVYKERLAPGQAPNQRIAELVKAVGDGTFDK